MKKRKICKQNGFVCLSSDINREIFSYFLLSNLCFLQCVCVSWKNVSLHASIFDEKCESHCYFPCYPCLQILHISRSFWFSQNLLSCSSSQLMNIYPKVWKLKLSFRKVFTIDATEKMLLRMLFPNVTHIVMRSTKPKFPDKISHLNFNSNISFISECFSKLDFVKCKHMCVYGHLQKGTKFEFRNVYYGRGLNLPNEIKSLFVFNIRPNVYYLRQTPMDCLHVNELHIDYHSFYDTTAFQNSNNITFVHIYFWASYICENEIDKWKTDFSNVKHINYYVCSDDTKPTLEYWIYRLFMNLFHLQSVRILLMKSSKIGIPYEHETEVLCQRFK